MVRTSRGTTDIDARSAKDQDGSGEKKIGDDDHHQRINLVPKRAPCQPCQSKGGEKKLGKVRCYYCGSTGHVTPQCPVPRRNDEAIRNMTREQTEVGEAFLDGGAEESVGGTKALELLGKLIGPEQILIDREDRPWFICEDGSLQKVKSKVTFHTPARRLVGKGGFYVLEAPTG